jgi:hypothetical protein
MKIKVLLWSVVSILIIGLAAGAYWWLSRPQVILFSDDAKVTLLAVQYGKRHAPPNVTVPAAAAGRAPARARGLFNTTNDTLVLWIRQQYDASDNQYHSFQYYVYDQDGTACAQTYGRNSGANNRRGNEVVAVQFDAFPRRQGKFFVQVQEQGNGGQEMSERKFVVSNPVRDAFAKWTAEPLPSTKKDEDLSVTLKRLAVGANLAITRNQDNPDDAANKGAQAVLRVQRNGTLVTNWEPVSVETSDATGNRLKVNRVGGNGWQNGFANYSWANDEDTFTYQYSLWPDEPAWKVKFEFSQQSDFADNELWNVRNLPVQPGRQQDMYNNNGNRPSPTNTAFAETDLNGYHLKIYPAIDFTDAGNNNWMQGGLFFDISPALGDGWRMTIKVADSETNDIPNGEYTSQRNNNVASYRYRLQNVSGLTNLNVSFAVHRSRFVEFTAQPARPAAGKDN